MDKKAANNVFNGTRESIDGTSDQEFMGLIVSSQKRIFSYIIMLVPSRSDAEDILQDTMTIMWRKFGEFKRGTNFVAWGISIARYLILTHLKSKSTSKLRLENDVLDLIEKQSDGIIDKLDIRLDALSSCIKKLSDKESTLLKMRYEQDLSFQEIASSVAMSRTAIFKAISLIHCKLMRCVKRTLFMEAGS